MHIQDLITLALSRSPDVEVVRADAPRRKPLPPLPAWLTNQDARACFEAFETITIFPTQVTFSRTRLRVVVPSNFPPLIEIAQGSSGELYLLNPNDASIWCSLEPNTEFYTRPDRIADSFNDFLSNELNSRDD